MLIGPAIAQGNSTSQSGGSNSTDVIAFDETTSIQDYSFNDGQICLTFNSDIPRIASITDVNSMPTTGAGQVNFKKVRLTNGLTESCLDLEMDRGSMTVTVAVGESIVAISNPTKPLFSNITRFDFYIEALLVAIFVPIQYIIRDKAFRYRLKRGLARLI